MLEPVHYVRLCLDRELTSEEFDQVSEIMLDQLGDLVADDQVIMHERDGQFCYIYTLTDDVVTAEDGTSQGDMLSAEIDQVLPDAPWELEGSLPDQEIEVPDQATESQIQETALVHVRQWLLG